jgi:hypothetical protein
LGYRELPPREEAKPSEPTIPKGFEEEFDRMRSDILRTRYNAEPAFRAIVDLLLSKRGKKDAPDK